MDTDFFCRYSDFRSFKFFPPVDKFTAKKICKAVWVIFPPSKESFHFQKNFCVNSDKMDWNFILFFKTLNFYCTFVMKIYKCLCQKYQNNSKFWKIKKSLFQIVKIHFFIWLTLIVDDTWSTSNRLHFSSRLMVDAVDACRRPFYSPFHHAQFLGKIQ